MYDIKGDNDLVLDQNGDLILEKTPGSLFKKAVISPKGYLTYEYQLNTFLDEEYGNAVYYKIRENLDSAILSNLTDDVRSATSFVNVPISTITASITSFSNINYLITYKDQSTQEITINV